LLWRATDARSSSTVGLGAAYPGPEGCLLADTGFGCIHERNGWSFEPA
jgi:hypothetical protein